MAYDDVREYIGSLTGNVQIFFERVGDFIDMFVLILIHMGFWITLMLFFIVFVGIFYAYIKLQKPIKTLIKSIKSFIDKFSL